ncbi:MAG TPA: hypothetical protein VGO90_08150 [Chthoniobacteraceae bacterium]|nr:hypothetical protein [Chthoniobacteraceae bacterium]
MAPDGIRNLIRAVPFRPFTVELGSGKRIFVQRSDYVSLSPAGRTLVVQDNEENMEIIEVFLITHVSVEGADPAEV